MFWYCICKQCCIQNHFTAYLLFVSGRWLYICVRLPIQIYWAVSMLIVLLYLYRCIPMTILNFIFQIDQPYHLFCFTYADTYLWKYWMLIFRPSWLPVLLYLYRYVPVTVLECWRCWLSCFRPAGTEGARRHTEAVREDNVGPQTRTRS